MIVLANKLYTSDETADVIGVTSRTLYRYVKNGEISPETKTKRKLKIKKSRTFLENLFII